MLDIDIVKTATVLNALAAIATSFISVLLFKATRQATEVATRVFAAAQRPYVGIESFLIKDDSPDGISKFLVFTRNFGTVPAVEVTITGNNILG